MFKLEESNSLTMKNSFIKKTYQCYMISLMINKFIF